MNLLKLARRNIWRNKRRTIITATSIFAAIFFALFIRSMQLGTYQAMIDQTIGKVSGYLQVQHIDYFDNPSLDNSMEYSEDLLQKISNIEGITSVVPRIETATLASSGRKSKPVLVTGINPDDEYNMSNPEKLLVHYRLSSKAIEALTKDLAFTDEQIEILNRLKGAVYNKLEFIKVDLKFGDRDFEKYRPAFEKYCKQEGAYLSQNDDGILVADKLATYLKIAVGDTLVLTGSGYEGATAAGLFPVRGLIKSPSPQLNNKLIYMTNYTAKDFLNMKNRVNYLAVNIEDKKAIKNVQNRIAKQLDTETHTVKNWQELFPETYKTIQGDNQAGQAIIYILYFVIFFGILGTVMMMVGERKHEFGVLNAVGMKKTKLKRTILLEMMVIAFLGVLSGIIVTLPLILYLTHNPIEFTGATAKAFEELGYAPMMPAAGIGNYIIYQIIVVFIMVAIACYIPLRKINKMKIVNALRS